MTETNQELDRLHRNAAVLVGTVLVLFAVTLLPPGNARPAGYWDVLKDVIAPVAALIAVFVAASAFRSLQSQLRLLRQDRAEERRAHLAADWATLQDRVMLIDEMKSALASGGTVETQLTALESNHRSCPCRTAGRERFVAALNTVRRGVRSPESAGDLTGALDALAAVTHEEIAHAARQLGGLDAELAVPSPAPAAPTTAPTERTGVRPWWVLTPEQVALLTPSRPQAQAA